MKFVLILLITLVAGCAQVPRDSQEADSKAKEFLKPKAGYAGLYIARAGPRGQTSVLELLINGLIVAKTSPRTFVKFELSPGRYYISARGENIDQIEVDLKEGLNQFIYQEVTIGWNDFRTTLVLLPESEGREAVLKSELGLKIMRDSDIRAFK